MRTEIAFTLPRGWVDASGETHREGRMRLATARDEIEPLRDPAVRENEAYLGVLLLARVVTSIGPVTDVTPEGCEIFARLSAARRERLAELAAQWPPEQRARIASTLRGLAHALVPESPATRT